MLYLWEWIRENVVFCLSSVGVECPTPFWFIRSLSFMLYARYIRMYNVHLSKTHHNILAVTFFMWLLVYELAVRRTEHDVSTIHNRLHNALYLNVEHNNSIKHAACSILSHHFARCVWVCVARCSTFKDYFMMVHMTTIIALCKTYIITIYICVFCVYRMPEYMIRCLKIERKHICCSQTIIVQNRQQTITCTACAHKHTHCTHWTTYFKYT